MLPAESVAGSQCPSVLQVGGDRADDNAHRQDRNIKPVHFEAKHMDTDTQRNDLENCDRPAADAANAASPEVCSQWESLSEAHMQLMHASALRAPQVAHVGAPEMHVVHAVQVPSVLAVDCAALHTWAQHAQHICDAYGLSQAGSYWYESISRDSRFSADRENVSHQTQGNVEPAGNIHKALKKPSSTAISLAQLQHACSIACGHHRTASALPEPDSFLVLMHALFGPTATLKLPPLLEAVSVAPAGRFVWPAFSSAMHGPQPLLMLCFTAHVMLAAEHPHVFAALEEARCSEVLLKWLQGSLLPVHTVRCAWRLVVLALVGSPLVLAAAAVAVLGLLHKGVVGSGAARSSGDSAVREWLHAVHCFDVDEPELIARVLEIEGRHRDTLLPLLLSRDARE